MLLSIWIISFILSTNTYPIVNRKVERAPKEILFNPTLVEKLQNLLEQSLDSIKEKKLQFSPTRLFQILGSPYYGDGHDYDYVDRIPDEPLLASRSLLGSSHLCGANSILGLDGRCRKAAKKKKKNFALFGLQALADRRNKEKAKEKSQQATTSSPTTARSSLDTFTLKTSTLDVSLTETVTEEILNDNQNNNNTIALINSPPKVSSDAPIKAITEEIEHTTFSLKDSITEVSNEANTDAIDDEEVTTEYSLKDSTTDVSSVAITETIQDIEVTTEFSLIDSATEVSSEAYTENIQDIEVTTEFSPKDSTIEVSSIAYTESITKRIPSNHSKDTNEITIDSVVEVITELLNIQEVLDFDTSSDLSDNHDYDQTTLVSDTSIIDNTNDSLDIIVNQENTEIIHLINSIKEIISESSIKKYFSKDLLQSITSIPVEDNISTFEDNTKKDIGEESTSSYDDIESTILPTALNKSVSIEVSLTTTDNDLEDSTLTPNDDSTGKGQAHENDLITISNLGSTVYDDEMVILTTEKSNEGTLVDDLSNIFLEDELLEVDIDINRPNETDDTTVINELSTTEKLTANIIELNDDIKVSGDMFGDTSEISTTTTEKEKDIFDEIIESAANIKFPETSIIYPFIELPALAIAPLLPIDYNTKDNKNETKSNVFTVLPNLSDQFKSVPTAKPAIIWPQGHVKFQESESVTLENKHVRFEDDYDTLEDYYVEDLNDILSSRNNEENVQDIQNDTNDSLKEVNEDTKARNETVDYLVDFLINEGGLNSLNNNYNYSNKSDIDHGKNVENITIKKDTTIIENNMTKENAKELVATELVNLPKDNPIESMSEKESVTTEKVQFERLQNVFYDMESLKSEYSNIFDKFHVSRPLGVE